MLLNYAQNMWLSAENTKMDNTETLFSSQSWKEGDKQTPNHNIYSFPMTSVPTGLGKGNGAFTSVGESSLIYYTIQMILFSICACTEKGWEALMYS